MVLTFLKKYGIYIIISILCVLGILQLIGDPEMTTEEQEESMNAILDSYNYSVDAKRMLKTTRTAVIDAFGVNYPWWNINRWYERDRKAFEALKDLTAEQHQVLQAIYNVTTDGIGYREALHRYLDAKYLNQLTNIP